MLDINEKKRIFYLFFEDNQNISYISSHTCHHRSTVKKLIKEFNNRIAILTLPKGSYLKNIDEIVFPPKQNHTKKNKVTPEIIEIIKHILKDNESYTRKGQTDRIKNYTDIFHEINNKRKENPLISINQRSSDDLNSIAYTTVCYLIKKIKNDELIP